MHYILNDAYSPLTIVTLDMFQLQPMFAAYAGLAIIAAIGFAWWMQKKDEQARQEKIRIRTDELRNKRRIRKDQR